MNDFDRGYFCAVSVLLRETCAKGSASAEAKNLFLQGGNPEVADPTDIEVFKEHGLM